MITIMIIIREKEIIALKETSSIFENETARILRQSRFIFKFLFVTFFRFFYLLCRYSFVRKSLFLSFIPINKFETVISNFQPSQFLTI